MKLNKKQLLFVQLLKTSKPKERRLLLAGVENDVIKMFTEIIYNLLHGNVHLRSDKKRKLRKYKQILRNLSNHTISLDRKRTLLQGQRGGSLFPILLPIISSVASRLL